MIQNYEKLLERLSKSSGLEKEELDRRVEAKRAKLAGLISKEGAAQVIAAELGISFENERLKLDELLPGMRKVNTVGQIINLFPVRTYTNRQGAESKVANMVIADDTSNVKVVLWDTNHIELIEKGGIKEGSVIEIKNGGMRDGEIHLGSFSELKVSSEVLENLKTEKILKEKNIAGFTVGDSTQVRAFVVQSFDPRFFHVCPECKKKVVSGENGFMCEKHGKVASDKRALINIVIDDGTESIRGVIFHDALPELGITELENPDVLIAQRMDLLGKELVFAGNVRMNKFFNNPEFIIDNIKPVDLDEVIKGLEEKKKDL